MNGATVKNEFRALVQWYWKGKFEVLKKNNLVTVPWNALVSNKVILGDRPANNNVKHDRAWFILDTPNN
jgi:hypothetical protein